MKNKLTSRLVEGAFSCEGINPHFSRIRTNQTNGHVVAGGFSPGAAEKLRKGANHTRATPPRHYMNKPQISQSCEKSALIHPAQQPFSLEHGMSFSLRGKE
jgi:hypothetical protein